MIGIDPDQARSRLAALGIPLFATEPVGGEGFARGEYARLLVGMVRSGDARLSASIPCLLAAHSGSAAARAVPAAHRALDDAGATRLLRLYRIARCLTRSRGPDLMLLTGREPELPALSGEPLDLPDPDVLMGELCLAVAGDLANERGEPDFAGEATALFDTWLRILYAEGSSLERA